MTNRSRNDPGYPKQFDLVLLINNLLSRIFGWYAKTKTNFVDFPGRLKCFVRQLNDISRWAYRTSDYEQFKHIGAESVSHRYTVFTRYLRIGMIFFEQDCWIVSDVF